MAGKTQTMVEDFLTSSHQNDHEYIDGEIRKRHWGDAAQIALQARVVTLLSAWQDQMQAHVLVKQRLQVSPDRFRIPCICLVCRTDTIDQPLTHPPLLCIEILSQEDNVEEMTDRARDYLDMGVPHIWILDPVLPAAYEFDSTGLRQTTGSLDVPAVHLSLLLTELFAA